MLENEADSAAAEGTDNQPNETTGSELAGAENTGAENTGAENTAAESGTGGRRAAARPRRRAASR
ncbi:hypothetical protein, partial [Actinomadura roseirufa]|uniref:hypothetical protein n=1 Tax=Actinomadura roseirufa TaxID=2094049 RepID=UPI001A9561E3